jgi:hypothetical protein
MTAFRRNRSVSAGFCHLIPSLRQTGAFGLVRDDS